MGKRDPCDSLLSALGTACAVAAGSRGDLQLKIGGIMKAMSILVFVALAACGSEGESHRGLVWGDAVDPLVENWCEMRARCFGADNQDECVRHNKHHLCELEDTCEVPTRGAEGPMAACVAALEAIDSPNHPGCQDSQWGLVPAGCHALLDLMPKP